MNETCLRCHKPIALCICDQIQSLKTRTRILILQHPQEPDKQLGTARLAHLALSNSVLRVGLSWPNLKAALGENPEIPARQPGRQWGVLYLGSASGKFKFNDGPPLLGLSKKGQPIELPIPYTPTGLVFLDGTWSQAKALWWRNAWLLKLQRLVLVPSEPSLYGSLRKEPRRESLSTLESIGAALTALGEDARVEQGLIELFRKLLAAYRAKER